MTTRMGIRLMWLSQQLKYETTRSWLEMCHIYFKIYLNSRFVYFNISYYYQCDQLGKVTPDECYCGPRNYCLLWPMMEIFGNDGVPIGRGYTDWKYGTLEEIADSDPTHVNAALRDITAKTRESKRFKRNIIMSKVWGYMVKDKISLRSLLG